MDEPVFYDGIIAEAVDLAAASGVSYFSAAGNSAALAIDASFTLSSVNGLRGGIMHSWTGALDASRQVLFYV